MPAIARLLKPWWPLMLASVAAIVSEAWVGLVCRTATCGTGLACCLRLRTVYLLERLGGRQWQPD